MNQFISEFHFLRPWLLLLWLMLPFLHFRVLGRKNFISSWEKVCDANLLKFLRVKEGKSHRSFGRFVILAGLFAAVFAAAGPSWKKQEQTVLTQAEPLMILLNLSSDMQKNDVTPNRLTRAKIDIVELLKQLDDMDSGLIVYTAEPFLISPLSADAELIVNLLPAVDFNIMPLNGDRPDRAIDLAVEKIKAAGYSSGNIVIFSSAAGIQNDLARSAAKKAAAENVMVNTVNMSAQDLPKLKQIAEAGGGIAVDGNKDMQRLEKALNFKKLKDWRESAEKMSLWQDGGYYFLVLPLLCCLYFFRRGFLVLLFVLSVNQAAFAGFFFNDDYEAMRLFTQGKYRQAAEKFDNMPWRGSALYKSGDFAAAAEIFSGTEDVEMLYNKGNALAKKGQIEEAVRTYEKVLEKNPEHEDAKFNLDYLKQQQQQQKQENNNQQKQEDSEQNTSQQQQGEQQKKENQNNSQQSADSPQNDDSPEQQENSANSANAEPDENQEQAEKDSENSDNRQQRQTQSTEEQQARAGQMKDGSQDEEYNELAQAREQKFREIPEDKGGLLKAFIFKEYQKNRYGD